MHIFEIKIMKKNNIKKIDFRVQSPLNTCSRIIIFYYQDIRILYHERPMYKIQP